jgi:hypothetical protein
MKKILFISILLSACGPMKKYQVELVFCDGRPNKVMVVYSREEQNNMHIERGKYHPTPEYKGELNVCEVHTIKELKK